jgi:hypothetical protein
MDESIPADLADQVLAKCARHCCICRRFLPLRLQIHHIKERASGGSNDFDNLVAVCLSCHSDVHSKVPFARRFTSAEIRQHRDLTYALVSEGKLIACELQSVAMPTGNQKDADRDIKQSYAVLFTELHTQMAIFERLKWLQEQLEEKNTAFQNAMTHMEQVVDVPSFAATQAWRNGESARTAYLLAHENFNEFMAMEVSSSMARCASALSIAVMIDSNAERVKRVMELQNFTVPMVSFACGSRWYDELRRRILQFCLDFENKAD